MRFGDSLLVHVVGDKSLSGAKLAYWKGLDSFGIDADMMLGHFSGLLVGG